MFLCLVCLCIVVLCNISSVEHLNPQQSHHTYQAIFYYVKLKSHFSVCLSALLHATELTQQCLHWSISDLFKMKAAPSIAIMFTTLLGWLLFETTALLWCRLHYHYLQSFSVKPYIILITYYCVDRYFSKWKLASCFPLSKSHNLVDQFNICITCQARKSLHIENQTSGSSAFKKRDYHEYSHINKACNYPY